MDKEIIIEAFLKDAETNEVLCRIDGFSLGSFEEQLHKIEKAIKKFKEHGK